MTYGLQMHEVAKSTSRALPKEKRIGDRDRISMKEPSHPTEINRAVNRCTRRHRNDTSRGSTDRLPPSAVCFSVFLLPLTAHDKKAKLSDLTKQSSSTNADEVQYKEKRSDDEECEAVIVRVHDALLPFPFLPHFVLSTAGFSKVCYWGQFCVNALSTKPSFRQSLHCPFSIGFSTKLQLPVPLLSMLICRWDYEP